MADRPVYFLPGQHVVYRPDHKSFAAFLISDQMRDVTAEVAEDVAIAAAAMTRKGKDNTPHKRMAESYRVEKHAGVIKVGKGYANTRVLVKVVNDDPRSAAEEFGGKYQTRQRMLGRAGAKFGTFKSKDGDRPK
jgi:hypothetical protein